MNRRYLGRSVLAALLLLGAYLIYLLPYQDLPGWIGRLGEITAELGWVGPAGFGLATAVLVQVTERITGPGIPLFSGLHEPSYGSLVVRCRALPPE